MTITGGYQQLDESQDQNLLRSAEGRVTGVGAVLDMTAQTQNDASNNFIKRSSSWNLQQSKDCSTTQFANFVQFLPEVDDSYAGNHLRFDETY